MTKLSTDVDPKLSDVTIKKLQDRHISTVVQFIDEDSVKLTTVTGLSSKDIFEIKRNILQKYGGRIRTAFDLFEIKKNNIICTNISSLDNLLEGGLYPGQIYEICGISSSGKTQLCLTIAAKVALNPNNIVRYIDTKRDFCGSRVEQILLKNNYSKQVILQTLERIKVCCIYSLHQLFKVLHFLADTLKEEREECRTRIIIIDSLPAIIFRFSKDHTFTIALNQLANIYHFIANEFHLSIINVNLITQWSINDEGASSSQKCNDITPTLGRYWAHVPNTRLLLQKIGPSGSRRVSIWKSHQLKENLTCNLNITDRGIVFS